MYQIEQFNINNIKSILYDKSLSSLKYTKIIDTSKLNVYDYIISNDEQLSVHYAGSHYRIPVYPGYLIEIKAQSELPARYVFLQNDSMTNPIPNAKRTDILQNTTDIIIIPDNCYYLYINKIDGAGNDLTPVYIKIINRLYDNFYDIYYMKGILTFNNVDKTINIIGDDSKMSFLDRNNILYEITIKDVKYHRATGEYGFVCLAYDLIKEELFLSEYHLLYKYKCIIICVMRIKYLIESYEGYTFDYLVEEIYYSSNIKCDIINQPVSAQTIPYYGNKLTFTNTVKLIEYGKNIFNPYYENLATQGLAIYNGYMFNMHHTGYLRIYDITKNDPGIINEFYIGSHNENNHSNCASFNNIISETGFPYFYVSATSNNIKELYVHKVSLNSADYIQKITFNLSYNTELINALVSDDNYIWIFFNIDTDLHFIKLRCPSIDEGDVTLSNDDIIDQFTVKNYIYDNEVSQDCCVHNGKLFFLFGGTYNKRGVKVYDTQTHALINHIDLTDFITKEVEGIDIFNDKIWITVLDSYMIKLDFK